MNYSVLFCPALLLACTISEASPNGYCNTLSVCCGVVLTRFVFTFDMDWTDSNTV